MEMKDYSDMKASPGYRPMIERAHANIKRKSMLAVSEAETAAAFEYELYYLLRSEFGVELSLGKELPVSGIVHSFSGRRHRRSSVGRVDALINNVVVEYKHHSKLESKSDVESAYAQVEEYLKALKVRDGAEYDAVLTDGLRVAFFSYVDGRLCHTVLRAITVDDVDTIVRAIMSNHAKKFSPSNIVKDFSVSAETDTPMRTLAKVLLERLRGDATGKSAMLHAEWETLVHLSVDDNGKSSDIEKRRRDLGLVFGCTIDNPTDEYTALFALQTAYAIVVKLIACKVLSESGGGSGIGAVCDAGSGEMQSYFKRMEEGMAYRGIRVRNLLEGDFFSWYADKEQWNDAVCEALRPVVRIVDDYSAFSMNVRYAPVDVFKDLYMGIIPQSVRHSMGEYFTPRWLADSVIKGATDVLGKADWKAIDPCCGSGIFIISLIRRIVGDVSVNDLTREERRELQDKILSRVYGVDINPLAVLSARVGYYMAISQLGEVRDMEIPVYLGDSALVPLREVHDGVECFSYVVHNLKEEAINVTLPVRLVESGEFGELMDDVQDMVNSEDEDSIVQILMDSLTDDEKASLWLRCGIEGMAHSLVSLHKKHWDGIWVRIIANYMKVAQLGGFDMIVGNPPWVKWEHLPAEYTRRIKNFCDVRHIFCNDGGMFGGAQLNICALISNVAATNWMSEHGVLAFLMPDSIMSQNSYEEFRNFYVDYGRRERLYLAKLDRWMPPLRPFKVGKKSVAQDFNTYYYSRAVVDYKEGVHVNVISRTRDINDADINRCTTWQEAKEMLTITDGRAIQVSPKSTAFTFVSEGYDFRAIEGRSDYLYRTGVESTPFEVFKLECVGPSDKGEPYYRFRNKSLKTARYKVEDVPTGGWEFDTRYIYPVVEGPCLKPFGFDVANNYHIVPYDEDNTASPVPLSQLYKRSRELAVYFSSHRDLLDKQSDKSKVMHRGEEFYALSKIGPYTYAPYVVAARDNTSFCASVITPVKTPWGEEKKALCIKHTIIISQDVDGNFITEDEAHYVNGILNSGIVREYIHSTFKKNGFSLKKSNLYLPKYDEKNPVHRRICELSRTATADASKINKIVKELTEEYVKLCVSDRHTE